MKPGKNIWWDLEAFGLKVFLEYLILMKNTFVSFSYMRKNIFFMEKTLLLVDWGDKYTPNYGNSL
jgi:hypothetical protein